MVFCYRGFDFQDKQLLGLKIVLWLKFKLYATSYNDVPSMSYTSDFIWKCLRKLQPLQELENQVPP